MSIASEDEEEEKDDSQLPSNVPDADIPLIRRLIAAITDGSAAEDNEGEEDMVEDRGRSVDSQL